LHKNITELVFRVGGFKHTQKVEGVEKLKQLKKLNIQMGGNYSDYSFLKNLEKLEILILGYCSIANLDFLRNMPNLEILVIKNCDLYKNEIDLRNNNKLKYLLYGADYRINKNGIFIAMPFIPVIKNISVSLEYLEIGENSRIILSKEFLNKLVKIPHVILGYMGFDYYSKKLQRHDDTAEVYKSYIDNWEFIQSHPNFILKKPKEVLPEKYQEETLIFRVLEDNIVPKMKEVPSKNK
jgi:hypothetical protein